MPEAMPPAPASKFVRCPGCGQRLGVRDQDAGRQARCTQCGELFTIGAAEAAAPPAAAKTAVEIAPAPPMPVLVSFECSLCQTRMTARTADVGKKMECPDCGRRTVIPPPPKTKAPVVPAAMSGEQYELWDAAEAPPTASKPVVLVPVQCRLCDTLMYATESQVGGQIKCPDCGAMTTVRPPSPVKPTGPQVVRAGEEYQLDPESAPTERPVPMPVAIRDAQLHEHARATTVGPDGRLIVKKKAEEKRPERPRVPLIQGVWRMLVTQEIIARWVITSILLGGTTWLAVEAFGSMGIGMIAGIFILLLGVGVLVLWTVFAAPSLLAVVSESADGQDRLQQTPDMSLVDWVGDALYLFNAAALAGAGFVPGLIAAELERSIPIAVQGPLAIGFAVVVFPLALLGALLENTPWGVVCPRLVATLLKHPGPWLLFYLETSLLGAATAAACVGLFQTGPIALAGAPFVLMAAAFVYMRLLGRLGWWLSDVVLVDAEPDEVDDAAAAHPHLAAELAARRRARDAEVPQPARRQTK